MASDMEMGHIIERNGMETTQDLRKGLIYF